MKSKERRPRLGNLLRRTASYWGLNKEFIHQIIDHAEEYVRGNVHPNGMENFWSLLKRGLNGTYISVERFHLLRYLDEQMFRYDCRELTDRERLLLAPAS